MKQQSSKVKKHHTFVALLITTFLVSGCNLLDLAGRQPKNRSQSPIILRFAVFGDAEPRPDPIFVHLSQAVDTVNRLNRDVGIDFVASVGDIAHRGTIEQYEGASKHIRRLDVPFFALMGNEEYVGGIARFLDYAQQWNDEPGFVAKPSFVHVQNGINFVFASAGNDGKDFTDADIDWLLDTFAQTSDGSIFLFTHAPAPSVFPDAEAERSVQNERFDLVLAHPRLAVVFSGHLHMNLNHTTHHVVDNGVQHIHAPGLERTKVPAAHPHDPYFKLVTVFEDGTVLSEGYNLSEQAFDERHVFTFKLKHM